LKLAASTVPPIARDSVLYSASSVLNPASCWRSLTSWALTSSIARSTSLSIRASMLARLSASRVARSPSEICF
jgi:hypothetical protein